ncbi:MAG: hypothetical protein RLZZ234_114 [Candidatus Parcubacteria bacterium]|jgi:hypothetical protein
MFKNFIMKKMLQSQTKHLPKDQQEMILSMLEKDPKLFETIALEMQAEMKKGKGQLSAAMAVLPKYKDRLAVLKQGTKK